MSDQLPAEQMKRGSHAAALVELMRDGRWYHMTKVQEFGGWRYGARLWDLKKAGWTYEKRRVGTDEWEYRLLPANAADIVFTPVSEGTSTILGVAFKEGQIPLL